jgi:hypothetical protein
MDRRESYRIQYPEEKQPKLIIKGSEYQVVDMSETGVRFRIGENDKLPGDLFHAKVQLHNNVTIEILGRIIRVTGEDAAMFLLVKKIPYQIILSEQAFLRQLEEE